MRTWLLVCAAALMARTPILAQQPDIGAPLGRLVDIGGRRLHFNCSGNGSPTILLEAGRSSFALDWSLIQPEIARTHRVCSYDRAGFGWSDPSPDVATATRVVNDLHTGLTAAGEQPPFVMVGASYGGLYVRLYQLDYPDEVVGLVFVDPATDDRLFTMFEGQAVAIGSLTTEQLRSTLPSIGSVPVPTRSPQTGAPFDRLPPDLYQLRIKLEQRLIASFPSAVTAEVVRESAEGERAALARLLHSRSDPGAPIGKVPVVVLTRGQDMTGGLAENHAVLAALSTNSRHTIVADADHEIHLFTPSVVIQAIQDVVTAARERGRLPARP